MEPIETAGELVRSIRREGVLVFVFPGLPGINLCPASALTPERRATLSSLAKEVRAFVLDNPERNAVRRFAHLNGASIAWLGPGTVARSGCPGDLQVKSLTRLASFLMEPQG